jgi:hypothetical protein
MASLLFFTSLYVIYDRYIQPNCSDFGGVQGVTGAGTVEGQELGLSKGRSWDDWEGLGP